MADIKKVIPLILKHEGGYQAMKEDTGNYYDGKLIGTNKGITPATYLQYFGKVPTVNDMKNITNEQYEKVVRLGYWNPIKADLIKNQSIANLFTDFNYNSGRNAAKTIQKILGLTADGIVGNLTINAINNYSNQEELFNKFKQGRINFIEDIIEARPANAKFRRGWMNRINSFSYSQ